MLSHKICSPAMLTAIALALLCISLASPANAEYGLGHPAHDTAAGAPAYSDLRHDLYRPQFADYAAPVVAAQSLASNDNVQDRQPGPAPATPTGDLARFASINVLLAFAVAAVGIATVASLVIVLQRRRQRLIHHQQVAQSDLELAAADAFRYSDKELHRMEAEMQLAKVRRAQAEALMMR